MRSSVDHFTGSRSYLVLFALAFMAACGGSDVPTGLDGAMDDIDGEVGDTVGTPPPASVSFVQDVNPLFGQKGCAAGSCHGGGAGGLTLGSSTATNYGNLVNVASTDQPTFLLVNPGDATTSYLVMKLEGSGSGARMPVGGAALSTSEMSIIRGWIDAGASNN